MPSLGFGNPHHTDVVEDASRNDSVKYHDQINHSKNSEEFTSRSFSVK
jgi:hypothetical protein